MVPRQVALLGVLLTALAACGCQTVGGSARRDPPSAAAETQADADDDAPLHFPELGQDPLAKSDLPAEERDPLLFPGLMNLLHEDRWQLEEDAGEGQAKRVRRQGKLDIRDPAPDTANFPNSPYTLAKGRVYIENSPLGLYGSSKNAPGLYQWDFLLRYGLTDNLEFRIFSNGLTAQRGAKGEPPTSGFSPLVFDVKMNFWEENTKYYIPAMGIEVYVQTKFGSPMFNAGVQPSMNLLFSQTLPLDISFEYNFGLTGTQNGLGQNKYQFSYQWAFQRPVVEDFEVFVHGFYNAAALPRILQFKSIDAREELPFVNLVGAGGIWTLSRQVAVYGSYNFGTNPASPSRIALLGFAVAF
jgi:hypothetical protein